MVVSTHMQALYSLFLLDMLCVTVAKYVMVCAVMIWLCLQAVLVEHDSIGSSSVSMTASL